MQGGVPGFLGRGYIELKVVELRDGRSKRRDGVGMEGLLIGGCLPFLFLAPADLPAMEFVVGSLYRKEN